MAAWVTAVAAIVVAISNYAYTWWRSRSDRLYARRRRALLDLQDACLALRVALHGYGQQLRSGTAALAEAAEPARPGSPAADVSRLGGLPTGGLPAGTGPPVEPVDAPVQLVPAAAEGQRALAEGRVVVRRSRVDDPAVLAALSAWQSDARISWLSAEDEVTAADEERSWEALNEVIGAALQSSRGLS